MLGYVPASGLVTAPTDAIQETLYYDKTRLVVGQYIDLDEVDSYE